MTLIIQLLVLLFLSGTVQAQGGDWEKEWIRILAAAKKEKSVVVVGSPDRVLRVKLPAAFKKRFGITLEYIGGRGLAQKLRVERRVGLSTIDVLFSGMTTFIAIIYPGKMLDPLKPVLILPEVVDPSKWKRGKLWFMDPEEKYILRLYNYVSSGGLAINTNHVKRDEFKSIKDLIDPKWKGKISLYDPTVRGPGAGTAVAFYIRFGEEFLKKLYVDQKPVLSRDGRQLADWLARGTYPISLGRLSDVKYMKEQGFPVDVLSLPGEGGTISAANGLVALLNRAPHPNAARVFVNWIASKEGMEILSRSRGRPTTRNDVDESFVPPWEIPRPGVDYFDTYNWEFIVKELPKIRRFIRGILASR